jgi:hypothetical protein
MKKESAFARKLRLNFYDVHMAPDNIFETSNGRLIRDLYGMLRVSAKMTEFIDFSCDFDASGECHARRVDHSSSRGDMCCCIGCHGSIGYLRNGPPVLKEDRATYEELFKEKVGFWRKGSGCSLPRELRSPTCIYYMCWGNAKRNESIYGTLVSARRSYENIAHHLIHLVRESKETNENNKSI